MTLIGTIGEHSCGTKIKALLLVICRQREVVNVYVYFKTTVSY